MPSRLPADVRKRLEPIRLLVLDVDGVLTDGALIFAATGEAVKQFHVRDGLGIRMLMNAGIEVAVVTGRCSEAVTVRCREIGIREELVLQGSRDKAHHLDQLEQTLELGHHQVAAMGDDLPDLPMLSRVGFAACPANAAPEVAAVCHLVCGTDGGRGAVREIAEVILKAQGRWQEQVGRWTTRALDVPDTDPR
jgi:3-deoxy-D-manno-octulosonate 8-phosphate phosphatase (KDO 8-P phosphatase)